MLKTEAIKTFLNHYALPDLAAMYHAGMETQLAVAQDGGERVEGEFKGRTWQGWSDGIQTWKPIRIPFNASTEPHYTDTELKFDMEAHVEAIGLSGWNWKDKVSHYVAFDFDALANHDSKKALPPEELQRVQDALMQVPWATLRKSTSGKGLHVYVYLNDVPTVNHCEHAAVARAVIGQLSALTGIDLNNKVDVCGYNMWIWHRKQRGTDGLTLLKSGSVFTEVPSNWKDHIAVVSRKRRTAIPSFVPDEGTFSDITSQYPKVKLDADHMRLIQYFNEHECVWFFQQDQNMLVSHTTHLQDAFRDLNLKGYFKTVATGKDKGHDHNCFLFPLRKGAWVVRRYTQGASEDPSWDQDTSGFTRCYFNRELDLRSAARALGGIEDTKGAYNFREAEIAIKAASLLGIVVEVGNPMRGRETALREHVDGRLIVEVEHKDNDSASDMPMWLAKKGKWIRIYSRQNGSPMELEIQNYDDIIRHIVDTGNRDRGWAMKSDSIWKIEPLTHIRLFLLSTGLKPHDVNTILGSSIFKCWSVVNKPFMPEFPGDREWNLNAAQLRFVPTPNLENLKYPTWQKILTHVGSGLDDAVKHDTWCKSNGILTGADYLKCWIASLFQFPNEPLPYLFLHGPQNSGKSIFHESISLLLTRGYKKAEAALISQSGFNAELEGQILAVVEETDLRVNKQAYARIKEWVTARELLIHEKGRTPYQVKNTTHFIQCSNEFQSCPIFPGDTRITMVYVAPILMEQIIPKRTILQLLEKEAPDFLAEILNIELPQSNDRLNLPIIDTQDKMSIQMLNQSPVEAFIREKCQPADGFWIKYSDFYDAFTRYTDAEEAYNWSKIRVAREIPPKFPQGRSRFTGQKHIGNIRLVDKTPEDKNVGKYVVDGVFLIPESERDK